MIGHLEKLLEAFEKKSFALKNSCFSQIFIGNPPEERGIWKKFPEAEGDFFQIRRYEGGFPINPTVPKHQISETYEMRSIKLILKRVKIASKKQTKFKPSIHFAKNGATNFAHAIQHIRSIAFTLWPYHLFREVLKANVPSKWIYVKPEMNKDIKKVHPSFMKQMKQTIRHIKAQNEIALHSFRCQSLLFISPTNYRGISKNKLSDISKFPAKSGEFQVGYIEIPLCLFFTKFGDFFIFSRPKIEEIWCFGTCGILIKIHYFRFSALQQLLAIKNESCRYLQPSPNSSDHC